MRRPCNIMELFRIYIPWIGSLLAESVLLWVMVHRSMVRRFPWFFTAIAYDLARAVPFVIAAALPHNATYFYSYWLSIPAEYTLAFAVIYEVFRHAFQSEVKFSPKILRVFIGLNLFLVGLAAVFVFTGEIRIDRFAGLMLMLDRSAEFTRCSMLLFLWAFAARLKIGWRHHLWGIVFGLGLYSAAGLITAAVDVATGRMCSHWLTPIPHYAYLAAAILWPAYLWKQEPAREPLTLEKVNLYRELLAFARNAEIQMRRALRDDH